MYIEKIFSCVDGVNEGSEKLYSVIMDEEEYNLYSEFMDERIYFTTLDGNYFTGKELKQTMNQYGITNPLEGHLRTAQNTDAEMAGREARRVASTRHNKHVSKIIEKTGITIETANPDRYNICFIFFCNNILSFFI